MKILAVIFMVIFLFGVIPYVFWYLAKQNMKFYSVCEEMENFLNITDDLEGENWDRFLYLAKEINKKAFHKSHSAKIREIKGFIKGKFGIEI